MESLLTPRFRSCPSCPWTLATEGNQYLTRDDHWELIRSLPIACGTYLKIYCRHNVQCKGFNHSVVRHGQEMGPEQHRTQSSYSAGDYLRCIFPCTCYRSDRKETHSTGRRVR